MYIYTYIYIHTYNASGITQATSLMRVKGQPCNPIPPFQQPVLLRENGRRRTPLPICIYVIQIDMDR